MCADTFALIQQALQDVSSESAVCVAVHVTVVLPNTGVQDPVSSHTCESGMHHD